MVHYRIDARIFYRHNHGEVAELARAIEPMSEHIGAVGSETDQQRLRAIVECRYFRAKDVSAVSNMLLRAAKYARGHMSEYFPSMQHGLVAQAEALEDAAKAYVKRFRALREGTVPVN